MKLTIGTAFLAFATLAVPACGANYTLELKPDNTKIKWTLGDTLHTVEGAFNIKHGTVSFDASTGKASGQVVVDVASGNSGSSGRDKDMHKKVLESAKYPEATFVPSHFEGTLAMPGTSKLKLFGTFTIHGAAHEVTMDVDATMTEDKMRATISFDIPYVAWGMKDPSNFLLKVGKSVRMSIETNGVLQKQ